MADHQVDPVLQLLLYKSESESLQSVPEQLQALSADKATATASPEDKNTKDAEKRPPRIYWTSDMTDALAKECHAQYKAGNTNRGGYFKPNSWPLILENFLSSVSIDEDQKQLLTLEHCKNKWRWLKDTWKNFLECEASSGLTWNEGKEMFEGDDHVWDGLAEKLRKTHYDVKFHKTNVFPPRELLREMFPNMNPPGEAIATVSKSKPNEPLIGSSASKKRKHQDQSDDETTTDGAAPLLKNSRTQMRNAGLVVNKAIEGLKAMPVGRGARERGRRQGREGRIARQVQDSLDQLDIASNILLQDYQHRLDPKQLATAFDKIVCNEAKARAFANIPRGEPRDRFLELVIGEKVL